MQKLISLLLAWFSLSCFAQSNPSKNPLSFSAYLETYYVYDFGNPANHTRPSFFYSFNRHNEVALNLGLIKAAYQTASVRTNIGLMAGTYANANLAAEPGVLKNIYEANAGVKISSKKNIWVDAGIFASHIGFESAIGRDCWTLTRAIMADNSPYYETGAKISYTSNNGQWFLSGLVLNGWQKIQRPEGNNIPAFGHQITYKPNAKVTINSSSFVGSDKPDKNRQMRYFHNLFGIFQLNKQWAFTAGFDIGAEQKAEHSHAYNIWYTPMVITRFSPHPKHNLAARFEYYRDKAQVIIATQTPNGFQTFGYAVNYDYHLFENVLWRIEARALSAKDKIFLTETNPGNTNYFLTTSFSVMF